MHGSPLAAAVVRAFERASPDNSGHLVSFRLDIHRAVPLRPLAIAAKLVGSGRRVRHLSAALEAGGTVVASASGVWMATRDLPVEIPEEGAHPPQGPAEGVDHVFPVGAERRGFNVTVDVRFVRGGGRLGPATAWVRLTAPLISGEEMSPLQRLVGAADLANGIASPLDFQRYVYINPDLSVQILRPPVDTWICLDSSCSVETTGVGASRTTMYDRMGVVGYATQTLFVDRRRG